MDAPAPPDPLIEAQLVDLHRSQYVELVHLAACFVEDVSLCAELVQDAYIKLPTAIACATTSADEATGVLRQLVLTLARTASTESGAATMGMLPLLRGLERDAADMVALHHYLGLPVEEAARSLGLSSREGAQALRSGEDGLQQLATGGGGS